MGSARPTARLWRALTMVGAPVLLRGVRRLPVSLVQAGFAGIGIVQGLLRPSRARAALRWAAGLEPRRLRRWRLAGAVLARRGRAIALSSLPAMESPPAFARRVTLEGEEHLEASTRRGGTILLGFHTLPGVATLALAVHGHRLVPTGLGQAFKGWALAQPSWRPVIGDWEDGVLWSDERSGACGLARIRRLLLAGATVHLTADGTLGREVFRIPLPAGTLVVRSGWWTLRRLTGAATLPVLARSERGRLVVRVHAPLPDPVDDAAADRAACLGVLTGLIHDQIRRAPAECAALASWPEEPRAAEATLRAQRGPGSAARAPAGRAREPARPA